MTSDFVIVSIKPCPVVGNDKHIKLCNFGGLSMICREVIEGSLLGPRPPPPFPVMPGAKLFTKNTCRLYRELVCLAKCQSLSKKVPLGTTLTYTITFKSRSYDKDSNQLIPLLPSPVECD